MMESEASAFKWDVNYATWKEFSNAVITQKGPIWEKYTSADLLCGGLDFSHDFMWGSFWVWHLSADSIQGSFFQLWALSTGCAQFMGRDVFSLRAYHHLAPSCRLAETWEQVGIHQTSEGRLSLNGFPCRNSMEFTAFGELRAFFIGGHLIYVMSDIEMDGRLSLVENAILINPLSSVK